MGGWVVISKLWVVSSEWWVVISKLWVVSSEWWVVSRKQEVARSHVYAHRIPRRGTW